ncbi:hypothetical protein BJ508DRAFT_313544 [Ascobolus immersus RN42]|uniref:Uncharacterized protein n=1 Tax=Ascobolus immersus RN42 TaxID=1160509 RepID=A0A3N4HIA1_ASCIM|nr:hypothetical protein BJ508DRAFT_313544 [Ascobolus immersus RN42]
MGRLKGKARKMAAANIAGPPIANSTNANSNTISQQNTITNNTQTQIDRLKAKRVQLQKRLDLLNDRHMCILEDTRAFFALPFKDSEMKPNVTCEIMPPPPFTNPVTPSNLGFCELELEKFEKGFELWRKDILYHEKITDALMVGQEASKYREVVDFAKREGLDIGKEPETTDELAQASKQQVAFQATPPCRTTQHRSALPASTAADVHLQNPLSTTTLNCHDLQSMARLKGKARRMAGPNVDVTAPPRKEAIDEGAQAQIDRLTTKRVRLLKRIDLLNQRKSAGIEEAYGILDTRGRETYRIHAEFCKRNDGKEYQPEARPPYGLMEHPAFINPITTRNLQECEREITNLEKAFELARKMLIYQEKVIDAFSAMFAGAPNEQLLQDAYEYARKEGFYTGKELKAKNDDIGGTLRNLGLHLGIWYFMSVSSWADSRNYECRRLALATANGKARPRPHEEPIVEEAQARIDRLTTKRTQLLNRVDLLNERKRSLLESFYLHYNIEERKNADTFASLLPETPIPENTIARQPFPFLPMTHPPFTTPITADNFQHCEKELQLYEGQFAGWRKDTVYQEKVIEALSGKDDEQKIKDAYDFARKEGFYKGRELTSLAEIKQFLMAECTRDF